MTDHQISRLDRGKSPPGCAVTPSFNPDGWKAWGPDGQEIAQRNEPKAALAAAWAHYEARHDPPGMMVVAVLQGDAFLVRGPGDAALDGAGMWATRERAHAAAWAWYWRRVAVARALYVRIVRDFAWSWPRCLSWPDEQVLEVERWLAEGGELLGALRE